MTSSEVADDLEKRFLRAGFDFDRESAIGGLLLDFVIKGPHGELVIIEVKNWNPKDGNTAVHGGR